MQKWTSNALLAVLFCAALASNGAADARGFCNADHAGDEEQQDSVAEAAAAFYKGGEHLMAMLKEFEMKDLEAVAKEAETAAVLFDSSAGSYLDAAAAFGDDVPFEGIDESQILFMARQQNPALWGEIKSLTEDSASAVLAACSEKASKMSAATRDFREKVVEDPRTSQFSDLLNTLTDALSFGAIVSATFANAGGEKE